MRSTLADLGPAGLMELDKRGEVLGTHGTTTLPTPHALQLHQIQLHTGARSTRSAFLPRSTPPLNRGACDAQGAL
jgi:hypothetical protein